MKTSSELNPLVYIGTSNIHLFVRVTSLHICEDSDELILSSYNQKYKKIKQMRKLLSGSKHGFISQRFTNYNCAPHLHAGTFLPILPTSSNLHNRSCAAQPNPKPWWEGWLPSHGSGNMSAWPNSHESGPTGEGSQQLPERAARKRTSLCIFFHLCSAIVKVK